MPSSLSLLWVECLRREGHMLAWQHCLTHICQGCCNYLAEDIGHKKNVIRSKIVPSSSQLLGQRFLHKSRSEVFWRNSLSLVLASAKSCIDTHLFLCVLDGNCRLFWWISQYSLFYMIKCLDMEERSVSLFGVLLLTVFQKSLLYQRWIPSDSMY